MRKTYTVVFYQFEDLDKTAKRLVLDRYREYPLSDFEYLHDERFEGSWTSKVWESLEKEMKSAGIYGFYLDLYSWWDIPDLSDIHFDYETVNTIKLVKWSGLGETENIEVFCKAVKKSLKELNADKSELLQGFEFYPEDGEVYKLKKAFYKKFHKLVKEKIAELKKLKKEVTSDKNVQKWIEKEKLLFYPDGSVVADKYLVETIK